MIFTGGGTESDNLAIKGAFWSGAEVGRRRVVTSTLEHHAVLDSVAWLGRSAAAEVSYVPVDAAGRVDLSLSPSAVDARTALVSVMWANNEVGTLQPVRQIAAIAAEHGAISHSDAVQAVGHIEVDFAASGLDLLSFTAHKLGGPYGIGASGGASRTSAGSDTAWRRSGAGGASGTLDVAAVAGFAAALSRLRRETAVREEQRVRELRASLISSVLAAVPNCVAVRPNLRARSPSRHRQHRFPGLLSRRHLDAAGLRAGLTVRPVRRARPGSHSRATCCWRWDTARADARSALRFSLGHSSTPADVASLAAALPEAVQRAKAAAAFA